ncbi:hypothetical protein FISHEDRAFT_45229 [Fistulina hepatica ATCC 64428]|uniref:RRM domain-containing protein n=1 Tax=Fistulina hepatica ATCC 64428 TaxID=1128425 RepID=A0A0D7A9K3_9AGAR|nr:hypothetical protein FISHEDRAFT_45229 [Fistulina hepatica ATCC 64428]
MSFEASVSPPDDGYAQGGGDYETAPHRPSPHPYLHDPVLYISNFPSYVTDDNLAIAIATADVGPFKPEINRDGGSDMCEGFIRFKFVEKAEKALATLQSRPIPGLQPPVFLMLSPYPPTSPPTSLPPTSAVPRLVKQLPEGTTDSFLYDFFRPFGALAAVHARTALGPHIGMVEFWSENDAIQAEQEMHCAEISGSIISVVPYHPQTQSPRRTSGAFKPNIDAPMFTPNTFHPGLPPQHTGGFSPPPFGNVPYGNGSFNSPPRSSYGQPPGNLMPQPTGGLVPQPTGASVFTGPSPFVHGPGQQVQLAPLAGPGSNSHSGLIDPCNLFCKNLDPEMDSNALFAHFKDFGQIVSARVMRNDAGESRGFGFVSFQYPDQAAAAMRAMNGVQIGSKQIVVRLHEPKQLRQEKLAARYAGKVSISRFPCERLFLACSQLTSSGATSPNGSEGGWSSPRGNTASLGTLSPSRPGAYERGRRGSGSYYHAALAGTLKLEMKYDTLSALSPVVRREVLTGDLERRIKEMDIIPSSDISAVVEVLTGLSLTDVVSLIQDPPQLAQRTCDAADSSTATSASASRSASVSVVASASTSTELLNATASAPEHPSTPVSVSTTSTPPRTTSPSGSMPPTSERDRMYHAVCKLESTRQEDLTDLLMSLPKRERAICLFNVEILRTKLVDAKMVLEAEDDENKANAGSGESRMAGIIIVNLKGNVTAVPATPQAKKKTVADDVFGGSPHTPDLSSRGPSVASSPLPSTPPVTSPAPPSNAKYTIGALSKLSAREILKYMATLPISNSISTPGIIPTDEDPVLYNYTTDVFEKDIHSSVEALLTQSDLTKQKSIAGKVVRKHLRILGFGPSQAVKLTIYLVDHEDLNALIYLNRYGSTAPNM